MSNLQNEQYLEQMEELKMEKFSYCLVCGEKTPIENMRLLYGQDTCKDCEREAIGNEPQYLKERARVAIEKAHALAANGEVSQALKNLSNDPDVGRALWLMFGYGESYADLNSELVSDLS